VAKRKKQLRDQRSPRHISVTDASQVIAMARTMAGYARDHLAPRAFRRAGEVAAATLAAWQDSPVVLRVDSEFAGALLNSDTDVELVDEWLARLPFDALAFSFSEPVSLHDGDALCHYVGCIVAGIRPEDPTGRPGSNGLVTGYTTYRPFKDSDGVRFLWLYTEEGDPTARAQTVSVLIKGTYGKQLTLTELIEERRQAAVIEERPWGEELATLVPLSVQLLLYLTAQEPDVDWPAPETIARPQQLQTARVGHVGWRVGSALRTWRREHSNGAGGQLGRAGGGWRLPPHIRKAHWHRVRVAERNASGVVVGSRTGEQGVDWHYEVRWYPPTPVNADEQGVDPVVRAVAPAGGAG
jgi:hypothetical protein